MSGLVGSCFCGDWRWISQSTSRVNTIDKLSTNGWTPSSLFIRVLSGWIQEATFDKWPWYSSIFDMASRSSALIQLNLNQYPTARLPTPFTMNVYGILSKPLAFFVCDRHGGQRQHSLWNLRWDCIILNKESSTQQRFFLDVNWPLLQSSILLGYYAGRETKTVPAGTLFTNESRRDWTFNMRAHECEYLEGWETGTRIEWSVMIGSDYDSTSGPEQYWWGLTKNNARHFLLFLFWRRNNLSVTEVSFTGFSYHRISKLSACL